MLTYSALTLPQQQQVSYLFADEFFGTDAGAYLYELDGRGNVVSRADTTGGETVSTKGVTSMVVRAVRDETLTPAQVNNAQMHMDALAVSIAEKLYQQSFEEVNK